jgi:uncharacterized membrane protein
MVKPISLLIGIALVCLAASGLMLLVMILASPTPAWYRRLNFGSIAFGTFMVLVGFLEIGVARTNEQRHQVSYYRGAAPVTPAQGYAAGIGFIVLGTIAAVGAIVHRKSNSRT